MVGLSDGDVRVPIGRLQQEIAHTDVLPWRENNGQA